MGRTRTFRLAVAAAVLALAVTGSSSSAAPEPAGWDRAPVGYGAGTTGGGSAPIAWVTTTADTGPGSLRELATTPGAANIRFRVSGIIRLARDINVAGDKTIDGRGADVTLTGRGLVLMRNNVVIRNLTMADLTPSDLRQNAILVNGAVGVWIDHCTLSNAGDKLIGVVRGGDITVSWTHFHQQEQVFQVGTYSTADESGATRVTVHHSWFDHTGYRNPVVSYGVVHAYNNVVSDWTLYGMRAIRGAQLLSQRNVFVAGVNKRAIIAKGNSTGKDDTPGLVRSDGDLLLNGARVVERLPSLVLPDAVGLPVAAPATNLLRAEVTAGAGRQDMPLPG